MLPKKEEKEFILFTQEGEVEEQLFGC